MVDTQRAEARYLEDLGTQDRCAINEPKVWVERSQTVENVWRMHSFAVVHGGKVVFQGDSAEARTHFAVQDLSTIYQLLERSPGKGQATLPGPASKAGEHAASPSPSPIT